MFYKVEESLQWKAIRLSTIKKTHDRALSRKIREGEILLYQIVAVQHLSDFLRRPHNIDKTRMNLSYPRTQFWRLEVQKTLIQLKLKNKKGNAALNVWFPYPTFIDLYS